MVDTKEAVRERHAAPDDGRGNGFLRFWSTMPGVLTALAALVTAAGTIYLNMAGGDGPDTPVPNTVTTSTPAPPTTLVAPTVPPVVTTLVARSPSGSDAVDPVRACAQGDERSCAVVLDGLVDDCLAGDGFSCDLVYEVTDVGSELEWLGATCGYEFATDIYAGECESVL